MLDALVPEVRRRLPDTLEQAVEVWVQEKLSVYRGWSVGPQVPAFTVEDERRIHLLEGDDVQLAAALSHELVHAMLGPSWKTLPSVAEEGLADWMQEELNRPVAASLRADHLAKAGAAVGGLEFGVWSRERRRRGRRLGTAVFPKLVQDAAPLDLAASFAQDTGSMSDFFRPYQVAVSDPRLYGVGYLVVSRVIEERGVEGLHKLCVDAAAEGLDQVPGERLLSAARLTGPTDIWRRIIVRRIRYGELMAIGRQMAPQLVRLIVEDIGPRSLSGSGREFLQRNRPVFGLTEGELRIDLDSLPGFTQLLLQEWPEPVEAIEPVGIGFPAAPVIPGASSSIKGMTESGTAVFWADSPDPASAPPAQLAARRPLP